MSKVQSTVPALGSEHDSNLELSEKREDEQVSHVAYENPQNSVHPLEKTKAYRKARLKGSYICFSHKLSLLIRTVTSRHMRYWHGNAALLSRVSLRAFKVDAHSLLRHLLSYLDKANLGNAKVAGLETDLKLTGYQYSVALTILYPSYM